MATQFSCDKTGIVNFQVDATVKYNRTDAISVAGWATQPGGPGDYFKSITEATGKVKHQSGSSTD